ncbi:MAG TPA: helix-turn-helix domain-containing protein, partial [Chitinophagales bacterium]|nr:helix-turn-helix domain-containing protein [Chitinophagales bacterium]
HQPDSTRTDFEKLITDCVRNALHNHIVIPDKNIVYITRREAADFLGISLPTLHDWSKRGILLPYKISSRIRYKKAEIEAALSKVKSIKYKNKN